jgi:uncharacterized membrane-anchored protein YhcB (DUF1043 family)
MGPSKEELEKYFKENRKYFDELAKNYKRSDPEYYKKYIAPLLGELVDYKFNKKAAPMRAGLIAGIALVFSIGIFFVVFFVKDRSEKKPAITLEEIEKLKKEVEVNLDTVNSKILETEKLLDTMDTVKKNYDYIHGKFLFKLRKYEEAEEYLKRVPKTHQEYEQVEYMLKEIKNAKKSKK